MKAIPTNVSDLIRELNVDYPDRCPDPKDSEREIWMKAGARRLVDGLLARLKYTEDLSRE